MKRTRNIKKPDLLLGADFHFSENQPVCRKDNYFAKQWIKMDYICQLQKQFNCAVLHAGDLFDHWKPSPFLLREAILHLPEKFYTVYGQHDLPQHNLELVDKCGINVLEAANKLTVLDGIHWGQTHVLRSSNISFWNGKVLVWHVMNYKGKEPWPGCTAPTAKSLLKKYPQYDLIVTGDNHKTFVEEYQGRILVNPGSLMRMDADQIDHRPCVFGWFADTNTVEQYFLPIEEDVVSREHIEQKQRRDGRIDAFVKKLTGDWKVGVSFEENLQRFEKKNKVKKEVMNIIYKAIETLKP
jgi:DNA repair exonuclease SbcCD nuclease subunit